MLKKDSNKRVTLKEMTLLGEVDHSILDGWVDGTKVTIIAILTNTAVYYIHNGRTDRRFVETLERIEVNESDIKILPVREPASTIAKRAAASKKAE